MSIPVVQQLSSDLSTAPQLEPDTMAWVVQAGFKSVVNNRPDFEGGVGQPTSAAIEAAALQAGLRYAHLPVAPTVQTPEEVARFKALLAELPKPILAFCRTGTRSGKLFQAATSS
ncbi:MAG: TIGR01244 family sulfur transferase [Burkholderiaceae bacterium]